MKFASEEIRTRAVHAYLEGKATARQLADILLSSIHKKTLKDGLNPVAI